MHIHLRNKAIDCWGENGLGSFHFFHPNIGTANEPQSKIHARAKKAAGKTTFPGGSTGILHPGGKGG